MSITKKEAIEILQLLAEAMSPGSYQEIFEMAISALKGPTREQVEKMRGEWMPYSPELGVVQYRCAGCRLTADAKAPFCPQCGTPMTDEAADILVKRLEEVLDADSSSV